MIIGSYVSKNWSQNNDIIQYAKTVRATFEPFVFYLSLLLKYEYVIKVKITFMLYTCLFQVKQQHRPQNNTKQQMNKCNYLIIIANLPIGKTTWLISTPQNPMKSNGCLHVNLKLHEAQINNTWNLSGTSVNLISLSLSVKWLLSNSSGS